MTLKPVDNRTKRVKVALSAALMLQTLVGYQAEAQTFSGPSGTMLLPLTPKLDVPKSKPAQTAPAPAAPESSTSDAAGAAANQSTATKTNVTDSQELLPTASGTTENGLQTEQATAAASPPPEKVLDGAATDDAITDDTTLKGTVQIVADDTEYDQEKNTFLGTGNAVALIAGQDSKLEADTILYDQNDQTMDARGNVRIYRNGTLTTGGSFKFKVTSDEYLITKPDTEVSGSTIIARTAHGINGGVNFHDGTMSLPNALYIQRNAMWGPLSFRDEMQDKMKHPDAFLSHQHIKFTAKKMVYERYKEEGNLTIFGGRMEFGKFSVPVGKLVSTVGGETRVTMPVTPMMSNNLQSGGLNVGPQFNTAIGKNGKLSWAPMVQFGGKTSAVASNSPSIGLAGQVAYTDQRISSHIAYGTVSNLMVADLKYRINSKWKFQSGINRYLDDGMFGYRRARLLAEVVHNKSISKIPYLTSLNFRSSAGWAQDNPQLINQSSAYGQLFGSAAQSSTKQTSAFRVQEHITANSHPLFVLGDDKWGVKSWIFGGVGVRGYSTGDAMAMGQIGPVLDMHLDRVRLQTGYTQSAVRGQSPFVFDQFIQGSKSGYISGDIKVSKYVAIGGTVGEDLDSKLAYSKLMTAAIGPQDCKLLLSRDFIRGSNRIGFDMLYGAPIKFDNLVMKARADQGQLGGM